MTRPQQPASPDERRTRLTAAAITGLLAGAAKAITAWLIDHLSTN